MKKLFFVCFVILLFSGNSFGSWAMIPTSDVVKRSDLILIGTLQSVSQYTKNEIDYSEGILLIEQVVAGDVKTTDGFPLRSGDKIKLKWQNSSFVICPRVEHKGHENAKGFWIIEVTEDGAVSSDYPWRFKPLGEADEVGKALRKENPRQTSLKVKLLNENSQNAMNQQTKIVDSIENQSNQPVKIVEINDISTKRKYSLLNALLVVLFSSGLYWLLYRSRFKIR